MLLDCVIYPDGLRTSRPIPRVRAMSEMMWLSVLFGVFITIPTTVVGSPCDVLSEDEWVWYPEMSTCYLVSNHSRDYYSSLDFCESFNGTLLSISGQEEDEYIQNNVRKCTDPVAPCADIRNNEVQHWIGLRRTLMLDTRRISRDLLKRYWEWIDGTAYNMSYLRWYTNDKEDIYEPNGDLKETCARLIANGFWADQRCETPFGFICEKEVIVEPRPPPNVGLAVGLSVGVLLILVILVFLGLWCAQRIKGMKSFELDDEEEFGAVEFHAEKDQNRNNQPSSPHIEEDDAYHSIASDKVLIIKHLDDDPEQTIETQKMKNTDTGPIYAEPQTKTKEVVKADIYAEPVKRKIAEKQHEEIPLADDEDTEEETSEEEDTDEDSTMIIDNDVYE